MNRNPAVELAYWLADADPVRVAWIKRHLSWAEALTAAEFMAEKERQRLELKMLPLKTILLLLGGDLRLPERPAQGRLDGPSESEPDHPCPAHVRSHCSGFETGYCEKCLGAWRNDE